MKDIKWKDAPEWADRLMGFKGFMYWCSVVNFSETEFYRISHEKRKFSTDTFTIGDFKLIEMRSEQPTKADDVIEHDNVNHPEHYQSDNGIECIDAIRAALGHEGFIAYCRGNTIKYNWRSGSKNSHTEDLKKGAWYSNRAAIEIEKAKGGE